MINPGRIKISLAREAHDLAGAENKFVGAKSEILALLVGARQFLHRSRSMAGPRRIGECLLALKDDPADDQRVDGDEGRGEDHNEEVHDFLFVRQRNRCDRLRAATLSATDGARLARPSVLVMYVLSSAHSWWEDRDRLRARRGDQWELVQKRQSDSSHARHPNDPTAAVSASFAIC